MKIIVTIATAAVLSVTAGTALAQNGDRPPRRPPQEAIDACTGATEASACSFEGRKGTVQGTCQAPPDDAAVLACVPEGHRPPHDE